MSSALEFELKKDKHPKHDPTTSTLSNFLHRRETLEEFTNEKSQRVNTEHYLLGEV